MRETRIAILTYEDDAGRLVSTPMGTQDFEDPSTVWFITEADSDKVAAITARPRVNVAYASDAGRVSLAGTAALNRDRAKLDELGTCRRRPSCRAVRDPNSALLEVTGETPRLWSRRVGSARRHGHGHRRARGPGEDLDAPVVPLG